MKINTKAFKSMRRIFEEISKTQVHPTFSNMGFMGHSHKVAGAKEIGRAISELRSVNAGQPGELGIARSGIEDAVRQGRAGYEYDTDQAA